MKFIKLYGKYKQHTYIVKSKNVQNNNKTKRNVDLSTMLKKMSIIYRIYMENRQGMMTMLNYEDPRVRRTINSFEQALLDLLNDHEYEKITVSQIANKARLNRATFYLHYTDKENLLELYLTRSLEDLQAQAQIISSEFSYDYNNPHPLFIRMFEHIAENIKFYKIMLVNHDNPQILFSVKLIIESFVKQADQHMKQEGIKFMVPDDIRRTYVSSAYLGTIMWWIEKDMPYTPEYMAKQLTLISTIGSFEDNPFIKNNVQKHK